METIIAVPVTRGILDAHFGHSNAFELYTILNDKIEKQVTKMPPPHEPGKLPVWIKELGVTKVITGGIGIKAIEIFNAHGIEVINGAPVEKASAVVEKYLVGELKTGANSCNH